MWIGGAEGVGAEVEACSTRWPEAAGGASGSDVATGGAPTGSVTGGGSEAGGDGAPTGSVTTRFHGVAPPASFSEAAIVAWGAAEASVELPRGPRGGGGASS